MNDLRVMLSPAVYSIIAETIREFPVPAGTGDYDSLVLAYEDAIMKSVLQFMDTFRHAQSWLAAERVHDIVGFRVGDDDDTFEQRVRLVFSPFHGVYVFTPDELPLDEMYDVRKVIAESCAVDLGDDDNSSQKPAIVS